MASRNEFVMTSNKLHPWKIDKIECNSMFLRNQIICLANCFFTLKQIYHVIEIFSDLR